jgi:hypothetical protein
VLLSSLAKGNSYPVDKRVDLGKIAEVSKHIQFVPWCRYAGKRQALLWPILSGLALPLLIVCRDKSRVLLCLVWLFIYIPVYKSKVLQLFDCIRKGNIKDRRLSSGLHILLLYLDWRYDMVCRGMFHLLIEFEQRMCANKRVEKLEQYGHHRCSCVVRCELTQEILLLTRCFSSRMAVFSRTRRCFGDGMLAQTELVCWMETCTSHVWRLRRNFVAKRSMKGGDRTMSGPLLPGDMLVNVWE